MKEKKSFGEITRAFGLRLFNGMKRYPAAIGMAAAASVIGVILVHIEDSVTDDTERLLISIIMALGLSFLISLALKTIIESNSPKLRIRMFIWIVLGCGTVLYFLFLYSRLETFAFIEIMRYVAFILAGFVLFMTAVFRRDTEYQEVYSTLTGWRLAITTIYTLIIWGGISLILFAIEELLKVRIEEELYFDTIIIAVGFFAPMFLFGGVPKKEEKLTPERIYKFFRILVLYVIAPLLSAYTVVFYIYALRILFIWDWPDGIVGNMVLWYALIGTVTMYFLHGMDGESKWGYIFGRWFPRVVILPIILLFISLGIRINAYGFTPVRYLLGVTGIWMLGCAIYMSIVSYKKRCTRVITISLVVLAVLSMVGPWSSLNIGRVSQAGRLEKLLVENNILQNGNLVKNSNIPEKIKGEISSKVEYLGDMYDFKGIDYLPDGFSTRMMKDAFGFDYTYYYEDMTHKPGEMNDIQIRSDMFGGIIAVGDYEYVWDSDRWESTIQTDRGELFMNYDRDENGNNLIVELNSNRILTKDIDPLLHEIRRKWELSGGNITSNDLGFSFKSGIAEYRIVFTDVELYELDEDGFVVGWIRFYVLVRLN
ncbi:MAG: DUF4153 domain-containing protein [Clostridia bacterium]|nr:DUF4153 domain-containing protein [Clostridia bacterium]